jgi:hypothetical protein
MAIISKLIAVAANTTAIPSMKNIFYLLAGMIDQYPAVNC